MATIFDGIRQRQPDVANDWAISTICQLIIAEGERLAQRFKPEQKKACFGNPEFSVVNFLSQAEFSHHQPANYYVGSHFLSLQVRRGSRSKTWFSRRRSVCSPRHGNHVAEFQTSMGMYFLACGTSRSLGISVSKLKRLSEERLTETRKIAKTKAFMLIWDNFNIARKRTNRRPVLKFGPQDLLPSREEAQCVQARQLWHIKDILYDAFPSRLPRRLA